MKIVLAYSGRLDTSVILTWLKQGLYDPQIATMEVVVSTYDQGDATGFIRLNALRLKVRAALKTKGEGD